MDDAKARLVRAAVAECGGITPCAPPPALPGPSTVLVLPVAGWVAALTEAGLLAVEAERLEEAALDAGRLASSGSAPSLRNISSMAWL
jgi:hypothetical protein